MNRLMMHKTYTQEQLATLDRLLSLVERLYVETAGFQENGDNQQHWYNRGYANGIVEQLGRLGYGDYVEQHTVTDPPDVISGHEYWAWGKAYLHGVEVGKEETSEVIGSSDNEAS